MRLTRQSNYAIRTLVYCAVNAPGLSRIADIAKAHAISELFLFKLIKPLVEDGLLADRARPQRRHPPRPSGRRHHPARHHQADRRELRDGRVLRGGSDVACPLVDNCDLNGALREALGAFFEVLDSYTIADLASKRRDLRGRLGLKLEELAEFAQH